MTAMRVWGKASAMAHLRRDIAEIVRALVVLALVFLNFAHAPVAFAAGETGAAAFCGDAPDGGPDGPTVKEPCSACRLAGSIALPEAPCAASAIVLAIVAVDYGMAAAPVVPPRPHALAAARGPPSA